MRDRLLSLLALTTAALLPLGAQEPNVIPGWRCSGICARDTVVRREGLASVLLRHSGDGFSAFNQALKPDMFRGKRVRYSAFVKTDSAGANIGLWMRVDGANVGETLQFDNMFTRPIPPTSDWTRHEIVLDVPPESTFLIWGLLVTGGGRVWIDDVRLEVVDGTVSSTHRVGSEGHGPHDISAELIAATKRARDYAPLAPANLNFERP